MQEEAEDQMDTVGVYKMMDGMCEGGKLIRDECQETEYLPLGEEKGM